MLQNLNYDKKKETKWKEWNKYLNKKYPEEGKHAVRGFSRFIFTGFTGVYLMADGYGACSPFYDINSCTRSHSNGRSLMYGVCDNPKQVIELYNAIFSGEPYNGDSAIYDIYKQEYDYMKNSPNSREANLWRGNHVIILHKLKDFRWHKMGPYIGDYKHTHEYYSEEENIGSVFSFDIYKVY